MENEKQRRSKIKKWKAKLDIQCLINQGWSRDNIIEKIVEDYNYSPITAENLYYECHKIALKSVQDYLTEASKTNIQRIISIADKAFVEGRYGDSLKALDMLNKMSGNYAPEKHTVITDEPIQIKFD